MGNTREGAPGEESTGPRLKRVSRRDLLKGGLALGAGAAAAAGLSSAAGASIERALAIGPPSTQKTRCPF